MKSKSGFTIVELLIVIVVIAILAAITIVAYNGIQNRANDSAVQSNINAYAKKTFIFQADNSVYPTSATDLASLGVKASQNSYFSGYNNLYYCTNAAHDKYVFAAKSKSGNVYYAGSAGNGTLGNLSTFTGIQACAAANLTYPSGDGVVFVGYSYNPPAWQAWTQ